MIDEPIGPPEIDQWYARGEKGEPFRVVGIDARSGGIEIQTLDGEVDEIDAEEWETLPLERMEPPEDSVPALDNVDNEDLGYDAD